MTENERFWAKVDQPADGCWEWQAYRRPDGYGWFGTSIGPQLAHRVSYESERGAIPAGLQIDHLCRNRACVRPDHLEPVTPAVNIQRGDTGKHNSVKAFCPAGHPFDATNTRVNAAGSRECRTCRREQQRARRAAV